MMSEDRFAERLSEYLDGDLSARERVAFESHLAGCESCREILEELSAVVARAAALADTPPEVELWSGIVDRLEPRTARAPGGWRRRFVFSLPQLAAAAALLVALGGGGTWLALRSSLQSASGLAPTTTVPVANHAATATNPAGGSLARATPTHEEHGEASPVRGRIGATSPSPESNASEATGAEGTVATTASFDMTRYDATIAQLQDVIRTHRADLDTSTVRIVELNLAIIDKAIADARHALLSDPGNPYLNGHLAQQLQRKVRLLQQATDLVAAQKG